MLRNFWNEEIAMSDEMCWQYFAVKHKLRFQYGWKFICASDRFVLIKKWFDCSYILIRKQYQITNQKALFAHWCFLKNFPIQKFPLFLKLFRPHKIAVWTIYRTAQTSNNLLRTITETCHPYFMTWPCIINYYITVYLESPE